MSKFEIGFRDIDSYKLVELGSLSRSKEVIISYHSKEGGLLWMFSGGMGSFDKTELCQTINYVLNEFIESGLIEIKVTEKGKEAIRVANIEDDEDG